MSARTFQRLCYLNIAWIEWLKKKKHVYLNIIWTDRFLKVTCCVSFFFKLYPAYYSQQKRDVVSLYIALLSCARESRKKYKIGLPRFTV